MASLITLALILPHRSHKAECSSPLPLSPPRACRLSNEAVRARIEPALAGRTSASGSICRPCIQDGLGASLRCVALARCVPADYEYKFPSDGRVCILSASFRGTRVKMSHIVDFGHGSRPIASRLLSASGIKAQILTVQEPVQPSTGVVLQRLSAENIYKEIVASMRELTGQDDLDVTQDSSVSECHIASKSIPLLVQVLSKRLDVRLSSTLFFDYPIVGDACKHIQVQRCEAPSSRSPDVVARRSRPKRTPSA